MFPEKQNRYWDTIGFALLLMWFAYFQGLMAVAVILFASSIHELGHLTVLWLAGSRMKRFSLAVDGMEIRADSLRLSYPWEMAAVLAGPVANLAAGGILGAVGSTVQWSAAAAGACWVLGIFNLLPAAPLDGWRILQLLFGWRWGPQGERAAAICGGIGASLVAALLLILMYFSGGNLWLLPAVVSSALSGTKVLCED